VELFRDAKIDWLGKKWYFLGFSLIFSVAGVLSMLFWHGIPGAWTSRAAPRYRCSSAALPMRTTSARHWSSAGVKDSIVYPISDTSGRSANTEVISLPEASDASHNTGARRWKAR